MTVQLATLASPVGASLAQAGMSASSPFDQPIVGDRHCTKCGHPLVRFLLTTGYVIYLHCELCGHEWNEPERRKVLP